MRLSPRLARTLRVAKCLVLPAAFLGLTSVAVAQVTVTSQTVPAGAPVDLGTVSMMAGSTGSFSFTLAAGGNSIRSLSFTPAQGGNSEITLGNSTCQLNNGVYTCNISYALKPLYAGRHGSLLHIPTTLGINGAETDYNVPVSWLSTGPQVAFAPGALATIIPSQANGGAAAVAVYSDGSLYIADSTKYVIEKISDSGVASIVAGNGTFGDTGDGGQATQAAIGAVVALSISPAGDLYFVSTVAAGANSQQVAVRRVSAETGVISQVTLIDSKGTYGDVVADALGDVYVSSPQDGTLTEIQPNGTTSNLACNTGHNPYGNPYAPTALALSADGSNVYFVSGATVQRTSTDISQRCLTTNPFVGDGSAGYSGDGGPAYSAQVGQVTGLAVDAAGDLYLADATYGTVRVVNAATNIITTIAGTGTPGDSGDGGLATKGQITPLGTFNALAISPNGDLYVSDLADSVVRRIDVNHAALGFASTAVGATSTDSPQTATLVNIGNDPFVFSAAPATTSSFSLDSTSTCPLTADAHTIFAPGTGCAFAVDFTPATTGAISGSLTAAEEDSYGLLVNGPLTQTVALSGAGTQSGPQADAFVAPSVVGFGYQEVGTVGSPFTATLNNISASTLHIASITTSNPIFPITTTCGKTLAPYSTCDIYVGFNPVSVGQQTSTVTVNSDALHGSPTIAASGYGGNNNAASLTVSPNYVPFGSLAVGSTSNSWSLNLSNTGASAAAITGFTLSDTADFTYTTTCGATVPAYTTCNILVYFTPKSAGSLAATLSIGTNAANGTQTVTLNGTGTGSGSGSGSTPSAFVSPNNVGFGFQQVGTTAAPFTITLNNINANTLDIGRIALSNKLFSYTTTCGKTLAGYSTCNFYVAFSPTSIGQQTGTLTIADNTAAGAEVITLSGYGGTQGDNDQISPNYVPFATQAAGTTGNPFTLNFSNTQATPIKISSMVLSDAKDFSYSSQCGATVAAYSSCNILVYFTPQKAGSDSGTLTISTNGQPSQLVVTLTGTAIAKNKKGYAIAVNPANLQLAAGQSGTAAFTFTPYGGYAGTVTFACSNLPNNAACSFSPAALTADGSDTAKVSQLTVTTTGIHQAAIVPGRHWMFASFAALLLGFLTLRRKRQLPVLMSSLLLCAIGLAALTGMTGCGAGILPATTQSGAETVQVTATANVADSDGSITQTANFTLNITQ
jgi:hypothetical protein